MITWLIKNWKVLIFNIAETLVIFLLGIALNLPKTNIIFIMLTFMVGRGVFGKALHFRTWYRCLIWSSLILLSLFTLIKVDFIKSVVFAIFSAFIMTGKSNLTDMYLWNNKNTKCKYQDIIDFIKNNATNSDLIMFENKIEARDGVDYLIYKYKFKEGKTFKEMNELLDMENQRIVEHLDKIAYAIRVYFNI